MHRLPRSTYPGCAPLGQDRGLPSAKASPEVSQYAVCERALHNGRIATRWILGRLSHSLFHPFGRMWYPAIPYTDHHARALPTEERHMLNQTIELDENGQEPSGTLEGKEKWIDLEPC